jgi:hypothetical protein
MTEVTTSADTTTDPSHGTDFDFPEFRRLAYFHGQMLTARDFQREQAYFLEKLKLRMRCVLGYGVVCGLFVEPAAPDGGHDKPSSARPAEDSSEEPPQQATDPKDHKAKVRITPGLGVDCEGTEIVVRDTCVIDLWQALPDDERDTDTVWIGVEYRKRPVEPTRTVYNSACADTSDCENGWIEDSYAVRVTKHRPDEDERCDSCCSRCEDKVLWLARIDGVRFGDPVRADQIAMNIRRPFGKFVPTVITGVNWIHGHTYTVDEAKELLGTQKDTGGLVVRFSKDIRVDTLDPGVVDIQVIEGGAGRNADTWYMGGKFEEPRQSGEEFTRSFRYRQTTRETLQDGDRVLITVRAAFLLDRCCRPVNGTNVGGRVPYIGDRRTEAETRPGCQVPPSGIAPWTSGTNAGGDVFESWFYITEDHK